MSYVSRHTVSLGPEPWLERQSVALQKNNAAALKAAAGAAATWRDNLAPGLEEVALAVLAEAERLAAQAA